MSCRILGIGGYLPGDPITNDVLAKTVDTNDEWIRTRTGIQQRYFAKETVAEMAYKASLKAIESAKINQSEIDLIIVCSTTPDKAFPSIATTLQGMLNVGQIPSFDLNAVCSGFIYGMHVGRALIEIYNYQNVLLVGAEKMSSILNMDDRSTAVLFGDGAGAVILTADKSKLFDVVINSDGTHADILKVIKEENSKPKIQMKGQEVYKHAVIKMHEIAELMCKRNSIKVEQVDFFVPHQANIRIIEAIAERMNIPSDKVIKTVKHHANTSAATIPLALDDMNKKNLLTRNKLILMSAIGAGVTYGGALISY